MRIRLSFICWCLACAIITSAAEAAKYDDLAAWAKKANGNTQRFVDDLNKSKTPGQVAAAIRANIERQKQSTDELIRLLAVHPELKDLPDLGLDTETFRTWLTMKRDGEARRANVPDEPVEISQQLRANNASIKASPAGEAATKKISDNGRDPDVAAAANELQKTMENNHQRLLSAFL